MLTEADVLTKPFEGFLKEVAPFFQTLPKNEVLARLSALEFFKNEGIPSNKNDEWKYTDLAQVSFENFIPQYSNTAVGYDAYKNFLLMPDSLQAFIFYNGKLINKCPSPHLTLINSSILKPLANSFYYNSMAALNRAFFYENASITIPSNQEIPEPIFILNIIDSKHDPVMIHPRSAFSLDEGSKATIVEATLNIGSNKAFTNALTEIKLAKNAQLTHIMLQYSFAPSIQVASLVVEQEKNSTYTTTLATKGGIVNRISLHNHLNEEHAISNVYTLAFAEEKQKTDHHIELHHNQPKCESNTISRGIVSEKGKSAFTGKIVVQKGATQSKASLENKNCLLSKDAEANTRPQLEIYNDDVQCSHGATIGHLEEEALFYLRSRGIAKEEAQKLLMYAFIYPALQGVPLVLQPFIEDLFCED